MSSRRTGVEVLEPVKYSLLGDFLFWGNGGELTVSAFFEWLYQVMHQVTQALGYPGVFILMLVENLFPPIPSEMVMPFAGFLVAQGDFHVFGILIAGTLGSLAGALVIYYLGGKLGQKRVERWLERYGKYVLLDKNDLRRALDAFERHGNLSVLIGRVIPGVRSLISLPAGMRKMPLPQFLALTAVGTVAWNALLIFAGFTLGRNWQRVLGIMDTYETVIYGIMGAALLYFVFRRLNNRRASEAGYD